MEEREVYNPESDPEVIENGGELVPQIGTVPADPNAYIANVERWMEFLQKIHRVFLKCLNPKTDLCFLGDGNKDVVHLKKPGKDRLLSISGGEMKILSVKREDAEDDKGKWYGYTVDCVFIRADGKRFESSYMVSSRAKFFGKAYGKDKAVTEILPDNVREAAITQSQFRAISKALGVASFTIEELKAAGVKVELIEGYTFSGKGGQTYGQKSETKSAPKEETAGQTDGQKTSEPARLGDKELKEIEAYQAKTGLGMGSILKAVGAIGYEALADVPLSKYEALKKEIKGMVKA